MKVEATEVEHYHRRRHHIADSGDWCLFTAMEKSTGAMGGADEVQSDRQSEGKWEEIVEAGMYRDIPDWNSGESPLLVYRASIVLKYFILTPVRFHTLHY